MRSLTAIFLSCAVLSLSTMSAVVQGRPTGSTRPASFDIEAHRGGRALRPENTLQSFANALSMGVDTLELDMGVTNRRTGLKRVSGPASRDQPKPIASIKVRAAR